MDPLTLIIAAGLLALGLAWLLLPVALFGIKPRLDRQAAELARVRAALERLSPPPVPEPTPVLPATVCPDCGATVPGGARECPSCLAPQRRAE